MNFGDKLNEYIEILGCSAKELADASDLSAVVISRYRSGERKPQQKEEQIEKLARGITSIAERRKITGLTYEKVSSELVAAIDSKAEEYESFSNKFIKMIDELQISIKDLSVFINFEVSYIYRIRSGQRKPNDLNTFVDRVCQYVVTNYTTEENLMKVSELIDVEAEALEDKVLYAGSLKKWLYDDLSDSTDTQMESFLKKLDEFNLDEYIRSIHFDELKVPNIPFYKPLTRNYYGISEMRKGELDFFKGVVLSKSAEPVFMCSDMPLYDMAEDMEFNKKWMFAIAMCLKKGLHLNIIHNVDRPFEEMMLGLEAWIPIYMTGQISPYSFPKSETDIYHHFNYVSGTVALTGECINGCHANGKYYLTTNKEEVAYYKRKSRDLLNKAKPLMEIYRDVTQKQFKGFLNASVSESGKRYNVYYAPPIYTISDELLDEILSRHNVEKEEKVKISNYVSLMKHNQEEILKSNLVMDKLPKLSSSEFEKHPAHLSLAGMFLETEISYTYEEYLKHFELCRQYADKHDNYIFESENKSAFRNIQVQILENKYVHISKDKAPAIHFIIRHPKMVSALSDFVPLVFEQRE